MESLKHLIGGLFMPLTTALVIAVSAAVLATAGRRRLAARLSLCAAAIAYLCAINPIATLLLWPLESRYPPLSSELPLPAVGYVVVLGDQYLPAEGIPITGALDGDSLQRIVEGVRLLRLLPAARLLVSGGAPPGYTPSALGYARLARALGVADESIIISDRSPDTASEARAIAQLLGSQPFILVTSAYHMPRAMALMRRAGTRPIPAPTAQLARTAHLTWHGILPTARDLRASERALHEYIGLAALTMGFD